MQHFLLIIWYNHITCAWVGIPMVTTVMPSYSKSDWLGTQDKTKSSMKMKIFALLLCAVVSGQHWSYGWHPGKDPIDAKYHIFFISRQTEPSSTCWRGWRSAEFVCTPPVADCTVDFRKFYFYRQTRFSSFVFPQVQLVKLHRSKFSIIECIFSLPASNFPFSFEDNFPN